MIPDIGNVDTTNINVVPHNNVGISGIRNVRSVNNRHIRGPYLKNANISDTRIWLREPPAPEIPDAPSAPDTPGETAGEVECPPPNARRIGDLNQAGTEKVIGYELTPDGKICETQWEALGFAEKYLPSVPIVSTTATIAVVATSSALLAKPLADLLLKVIKPVVKKVLAKVDKIRGKKEKVLSVKERMEAQRDRNQAIQTLKKAVKK